MGIVIGVSPPVANGIISTVGDVAKTIGKFLGNSGAYCVKIINAALGAFTKLVFSAVDILTADPETGEFSDFWGVINRLSGVLGVIASTLMVLLFVMNLATEAWDSRHELEIWGFVKSIIKMLVAIVIVNNAVLIVTAILRMGAAVAGVVSFNSGFADGSVKLCMQDKYAQMLSLQVDGAEGIVLFLVYFAGAALIVGSAVQVCLEIYQRIFKMYILIPFSTISFTTVVMGDNRGNEIFRGYLKAILQTAAEAVIILVCLSFSDSLLESGHTMEKLFPAIAEDSNVQSLTVNTIEDEIMLELLEDSSLISKHHSVEEIFNQYASNMENYSSALVQEIVGQNLSYANVSQGIKDFAESGYSMLDFAAHTVNGHKTSYLTESVLRSFRPYVLDLYPPFDWGNALMVLLQIAFPCLLCAGAVKGVGQFSSMIFGR